MMQAATATVPLTDVKTTTGKPVQKRGHKPKPTKSVVVRNTELLEKAIKRAQPRLRRLVETNANEQQTTLLVHEVLTSGLGFVKAEEVRAALTTLNSGKADFQLVLDKKVVAFVEVKKANANLNHGKIVQQALGYAKGTTASCVILTNGVRWRVFSVSGAGKALLVADVNLLDLKAKQAAKELFVVSRFSFKRNVLGQHASFVRATEPASFAKLLSSERVVKAIRREFGVAFNLRPTPETIKQVVLQHLTPGSN